jgi:hypothetical protein
MTDSLWRGTWWKLCSALFGAVLVAGCGDTERTPPPVVYPVKGKLVDKAGKPVTEGMIELVTIAGEPRSARGELASDGSFSLSVMTVEGTKYEGAEEGEYRATYIPRMSEQQTEQPVSLPKNIKIAAGSNNLDLRLP